MSPSSSAYHNPLGLSYANIEQHQLNEVGNVRAVETGYCAMLNPDHVSPSRLKAFVDAYDIREPALEEDIADDQKSLLVARIALAIGKEQDFSGRWMGELAESMREFEQELIYVDDLNLVVVDFLGELDHHYGEHIDNQPVTNTVWPLDLPHDMDAEDAQTFLARENVSMTVVEVFDEDGETSFLGLAATGGGMDMSAEVAKAYVTLGEYPPAALEIDSPAGHVDMRAAQALMESYRAVKERVGMREQRLQSVVDAMSKGVESEPPSGPH